MLGSLLSLSILKYPLFNITIQWQKGMLYFTQVLNYQLNMNLVSYLLNFCSAVMHHCIACYVIKRKGKKQNAIDVKEGYLQVHVLFYL